MHCAVIYYRIGLWRYHFKDGCIELTTPSSSRLGGRYRRDLFALLPFEYQVRLYSTLSAMLRLNVVFGQFIFCQLFSGEALVLPTNRRIFNRLDGMRFVFIVPYSGETVNVQVIEKARKKAQFSFWGQRKAFHHEIVLRGIRPYFLHGGERLACFELQPRQLRFGEFWGTSFTLWSRKLCCWKGI